MKKFLTIVLASLFVVTSAFNSHANSALFIDILDALLEHNYVNYSPAKRTLVRELGAYSIEEAIEIINFRFGDPHFKLGFDLGARLDRVEAPSISTRNREAVIRIPNFVWEVGQDDVATRVRDLLRRTAHQSLVFDLRGNRGGALNAMAGVLAALVDTKIVLIPATTELPQYLFQTLAGDTFFQEGFAGVKNRIYKKVEKIQHKRIRVMVDRSCASACEYFAYALQRNGVRVVGEPTAGVLDTNTKSFHFRSLEGAFEVEMPTHRAFDEHGVMHPQRVYPN